MSQIKHWGWSVGACYGTSQNQAGMQWILSQLGLKCVLFWKFVKRQVQLFCQLKHNYKIWPTSISDKEKTKFRIREAPSLLTNAERSTDTKRNIQVFFAKKKFKMKKSWQRVPPAEGDLPCKFASIALRKVLACPEIFGAYKIFLLNYHIFTRLFALSPEMCGGISNRSGDLFYIKNYQNV